MYTYALMQQPDLISRSDGTMIPADPLNVDYADYLDWVAGGNTPTDAPTIQRPTTISASAFLSRFTQTEELAVQSACASSPQLGFGLTLGLARGAIDLAGAVLAQWMDGLVSVGALTQDRSTEIMTP